MRKEDFFFNIQVQKPMEFTYNDKTYSIKSEKTDSGNQIILFGRLYEEEKFESYGEFMNNAKVENSFFKDLLEDLNL